MTSELLKKKEIMDDQIDVSPSNSKNKFNILKGWSQLAYSFFYVRNEEEQILDIQIFNFLNNAYGFNILGLGSSQSLNPSF